ncbi:DUF2283 domain-containing protein [Euhalothece natronophila Z-M001]|uniref:DUF2283 domain-containing protein n=1 Tax=Euhalothece natronophila Z-M001 TaxID=522448 RepID=A0A5B8NP88_9CHRO|nr:DUF2283 domain-containing protein [Euhalothece natronophila]QDZ40756.1 DUF2283 domain-containing protein [Euhalothece natronophila Z-M001]
MKIKYDAEVDVLRVHWSNDSIEESDETEPGVILDYNEKGIVIGVEVLNASQTVENWQKIQEIKLESC